MKSEKFAMLAEVSITNKMYYWDCVCHLKEWIIK